MSLPLHPAEHLGPGDWFACFEAERPPDQNCVYEERCAKCIIKAQADLAAGAEDDLMDVETGEPCTMTDMIAEFYGAA